MIGLRNIDLTHASQYGEVGPTGRLHSEEHHGRDV